MDNAEESHQAFLDFLYSRLNAAFRSFHADEHRDSHAGWWHANFQIEVRGIALHIGTARLLGLSCKIPFFIKQLSNWIDINQPPTGLHPEKLDDTGYLPDSATTYPWRLMKGYDLAWWDTPGVGVASEMTSWKPKVQRAFSAFQSQIAKTQTSPMYGTADEAPACVAEATVHEVSLVLDGVRDVMASVTESIEYSQATISDYQQAYLEERHGVRILPQPPSPAATTSAASEEADTEAVSIHRDEREGLVQRMGDAWRHPSAKSQQKGKQRQGARAKVPNSGRFSRDVSLSTAHAATAFGTQIDNAAVSPSPVSSVGLTNTSDEDRN